MPSQKRIELLLTSNVENLGIVKLIFNEVLRFEGLDDADAQNLTFVYKFFRNTKAISCF